MKAPAAAGESKPSTGRGYGPAMADTTVHDEIAAILASKATIPMPEVQIGVLAQACTTLANELDAVLTRLDALEKS